MSYLSMALAEADLRDLLRSGDYINGYVARDFNGVICNMVQRKMSWDNVVTINQRLGSYEKIIG